MSPDHEYQRDRAFTEKWIPEIQRIIGSLLVRPAPFHLDVKQATDLIVMNVGPLKIAARVRRPGYFLPHYRKQFTIRSHRDTGAETELSKIEKGFGDWFFYGFGDEQ